MQEMLKHAQDVLRMEAEAVLELVPRIDANFAAAVEMILQCPGRTVITGMGKSGIIGRKMAATLASTGTPSFYLHPAIGAKIIAMVGNDASTLAKNADVVLNVGVSKEACPLGLAPTSSTTAALAYGDALALALLQRHHFTASQFAIFHPGGSLGRRLLLTVGDIMHSGEENPVVVGETTVQEALFVITDKGLGAVSVIDANGVMQGVLTDGDIRRGLSKGVDFLQRPVTELMTKQPKTITKDKLAAQALHIMESNHPKPITVLPVVDADNKVIGLLHMTDLVRQGVV